MLGIALAMKVLSLTCLVLSMPCQAQTPPCQLLGLTCMVRGNVTGAPPLNVKSAPAGDVDVGEEGTETDPSHSDVLGGSSPGFFLHIYRR